jgi:hypothetical protein
MTDQTQAARQIAVEAETLIDCPSCGGIHRTEVDPVEAYKLANMGFSQGRYRHLFPDRRALTDAVQAVIEGAPMLCAGATQAPVKPKKPEVTKPVTPAAAPARPAPPPATPRDAALASLPPDRREALLRRASDLGVHRADDVIWALVASVVDAAAAAQVAGRHVEALTEATAKVPDLVYQGTVKAGADLKAAVSQAIENKTAEAGAALVQVIGAAASKGATDLQKAAAGLERVGQEHGTAFVEQWKASLAQAVERQARSALAWRLASGWGVVAFTIILMLMLGAGIGLGGALVEHKLITSRYLQFRRAATGGRPVVRFSGSQPIYKVADCPSQDTCLAVPN